MADNDTQAERPLMPKATAVWLIDNTTLTFQQIADFTGLHLLEVNGIADGEVGVGIKGLDPITSHQLTREEITRCEKDSEANLQLVRRSVPRPVEKGRRGRFTPVAIRQNRPAAIAWLLRYHPELSHNQIVKLVGTTKATIEAVRNRTHWSIRTLRPADPVALGLCRQVDLDEMVQKASRRKARSPQHQALTVEERRNLLSSDEALAPIKDPVRPIKSFEGLENFSLTQPASEEESTQRVPSAKDDPEQFFKLPSDDSASEDSPAEGS